MRSCCWLLLDVACGANEVRCGGRTETSSWHDCHLHAGLLYVTAERTEAQGPSRGHHPHHAHHVSRIYNHSVEVIQMDIKSTL